MPVQTRSMTKPKPNPVINEEYKFHWACFHLTEKYKTLDTDSKILKAAGDFLTTASLAVDDEHNFEKIDYLKFITRLSSECFWYILQLRSPSFTVEKIKIDNFQYYYRNNIIKALGDWCFRLKMIIFRVSRELIKLVKDGIIDGNELVKDQLIDPTDIV
jgi:hypothetical protein